MGPLNRWQYWLLGLVALVYCVWVPPVFANLPTTVAQTVPPRAVVNGSVAAVDAWAALETQAQASYTAGRYREAEQQLQQLRQGYHQAGNRVRAAIAASNLSLTQQKLGQWASAKATLEEAWSLLKHQSVPQGVLAQVMDVQGQLDFATGNLDVALQTWRETAALYRQLSNVSSQIRSRLNQAQALQAQGLFQQVLRTLQALQVDIEQFAIEPNLKAAALQQLGESFRVTGNLGKAEHVLQASLGIAQAEQTAAQPELIAVANLSLGNLRQTQMQRRLDTLAQVSASGGASRLATNPQALADADAALSYYQAAIAQAEQTAAQPNLPTTTTSLSLKEAPEGVAGLPRLALQQLNAQAHVNIMQLLTRPEVASWQSAIAFYPYVWQSLAPLPSGRTTLFSYVSLADALISLQAGNKGVPIAKLDAEVMSLLSTAQQQADNLQDPYAQSLVQGTLGTFHEQAGQLETALQYSNRALRLAQQVGADDISYRWQWQRGRILSAEGGCGFGMVYQETGVCAQAIGAYTAAFDTLTALRSDLVTANPDVRFSFRQRIEPIYRELAGLLLASVPTLAEQPQPWLDPVSLAAAPQQARLQKARKVMEALRIAELENFFQAACIDQEIDVDQLAADSSAAIVQTILLSEPGPLGATGTRLEVLVKLPPAPRLASHGIKQTGPNTEPDDNSGRLFHYAVLDQNLSGPSIQQTLQDMRKKLIRGDSVLAEGQRLYDWLLRPAVDAGLIQPAAATSLNSPAAPTPLPAAASGGIQTLVFGLDGDLRLLPMAALHDGKHYLIENYAVSLILGLETRQTQPLPDREQLQVLAGGLAEFPKTQPMLYAPLPNVEAELGQIAAIDRLSTTALLNSAFTREALEQQLRETDYNIVHFATHGEFGRDRNDTFILVATDDFDETTQPDDTPQPLSQDLPFSLPRGVERINISALGQIFPGRRQEQTNLELLILSACKTATGDSRDVLGIAGAAVQAGAKSAIATLWSVDDAASVDFATHLYAHLGEFDTTGQVISRAEALRRSQQELLRLYPERPRYWAPYILVGSWL